MDYFSFNLYDRKRSKIGEEFKINSNLKHTLTVHETDQSAHYQVMNSGSLVSELKDGFWLNYQGLELTRKNGFNKVLTGYPKGNIEIFWHDIEENWQINIGNSCVAKIIPPTGIIAWATESLANFSLSKRETAHVVQFCSKELQPELALTLLAYTVCPSE